MKIKTYFDTILAIGAIILLILVIRLQVRIIANQQNETEEERPAAVNNQHETLAGQLAQAVELHRGAEPIDSQQVSSATVIASGIMTPTDSISETPETPVMTPFAVVDENVSIGDADNEAEPANVIGNQDAVAGHPSVTAVGLVGSLTTAEETVEEETLDAITPVSTAELLTDTRLAVSTDSAVGSPSIAVSPASAQVDVVQVVEPQSAPLVQQQVVQQQVVQQQVVQQETSRQQAAIPRPFSVVPEATISVPEGYNVNARYTTDIDSAVLYILPLGSAWTAIGRSIDTAWVQIVLADGNLAWVFTESIVSDQSVAQLPVTLAPPLIGN